jgi:uncharacterized repeat protein (TIGR02543 family)
MALMFRNCSSLTTLDLSNFDTSKVNRMAYIFANCSSLTSLDLSNFDTNTVSYIDDMFENCTNLKIIATSDANLIEEAQVISGSTITFNANDGKFSDDTIEKTTTVIKTVPNFKKETIDNVIENLLNNIEKPTREGYIFNDWSTDNIGSNIKDILNATYIASWKANTPPTITVPPAENDGNNKPSIDNGNNSSGSNNSSSNNTSSSNTSSSNSSVTDSSNIDNSESDNSSKNESSDIENNTSTDNNKENDDYIDKGISDIEDNISGKNDNYDTDKEAKELHNNSGLLIALASSIIAGLGAGTFYLRKRNKKDKN